MQFKTHFCLVSAQAAPNLLPLLDEAVKPEKVVLLVTPKMKDKADYLEAVIRTKGVKVEQQEFIVSDDFDAMQERLLELIAAESAEPEQIALNATGGTKWMAIAAQEVFRLNDSPVFYVDVDQDQVLFVDKNREPHKLAQSVDLNSYIQAYGYEMRETSEQVGLKPELRELCQQLALKVGQWQSALGQLNLLASVAQDKKTLSVSIGDTLGRQPEDPHLDVLLREFEHAGVLRTEGAKVIFADEDSQVFANGGWLELYVNSLLNSLKGESVIQNKHYMNLHIQRKGATSHNEVDACFMAGNRLHLIECKTKRMAGKGTAQMTTDTMYKLDSISELGGLSSKAMLVSYRPLNDADKQRAKDLRIRVVEGRKVQELKSELVKWIQGS